MTLKLNRSFLKLNALVFSCAFMLNAQAGMLDSTLDLTPTLPDIYSDGIDVDYSVSGTTGTLTTTGGAAKFITYADGTAEDILNSDTPPTDPFIPDVGTFSLSATINTSTNEFTTGMLTIGGYISSMAPSDTNLLTASLAQIGGSGMAMNFIFNITGGYAAGLFGGQGATIGVIMDMGSTGYNTIASFGGDFSAGGRQSDTFVAVPEPSALSIMLLGLLGLGLRKKHNA
jgi:hypothetical protein